MCPAGEGAHSCGHQLQRVYTGPVTHTRVLRNGVARKLSSSTCRLAAGRLEERKDRFQPGHTCNMDILLLTHASKSSFSCPSEYPSYKLQICGMLSKL